MDIKIIFVYIVFFIFLITNIYIYISISKKNDILVPENSKMEAHMILIDRKLSQIKSDLDNILDKIESLENTSILEFDETGTYIKSGMNIQEIAKKTNKSIKEVELMLKMKGLI